MKTKSITIKNPKFGNSTWFLHCSSFNYPKRPKKIEKQKYIYFKLFYNIRYLVKFVENIKRIYDRKSDR